jgi:hypothetical protein
VAVGEREKMKSTLDTLFPVLGVLVGFYSIIFHKRLGRKAARVRRKFFHMHISEASETGMQMLFLVGGVLLVVFEILVLLGIVK